MNDASILESSFIQMVYLDELSIYNFGGYVEPSMMNGLAPTVPLLKEFEQLVEAKEKEIQELSDQRSAKITCVRTTLQKILEADSITKEWTGVIRYFSRD